MTVRSPRGPRNPFTRYEVPKKQPGVTTAAEGEEGATKPKPKPKPRPDVTTAAIGEEGGGNRPKPRPDVTTTAIGEEGGHGH